MADEISDADDKPLDVDEPDPITFLWNELDDTAQGRQTKREVTEQFDRIRAALIPQLRPFSAMFEDLQKALVASVPIVDTSRFVKSWPVAGIDTSKFLPDNIAELSGSSGQALKSWNSDYLRLAEQFSQYTLPAIKMPTWTFDLTTFDAERWIRVIPPELRAAGETRLDRLPELDEIALKEGISVAWACPGHVIDRLLAADSAAERQDLLANHESDILDHCSHVLRDLEDHEELGEWVSLVQEAISVEREGFHRAAQALAANMIESLAMRVLGGGSNASKQWGVDIALDEEPFRFAMMVLTLRPLVTAFTPFNPNWSTPIPEGFSRHATVHQIDHPDVCRPEFATAGVMLATALIFLVDRWDPDETSP